jgi:putative Mg2+ transporter-C (MgtC) family protein
MQELTSLTAPAWLHVDFLGRLLLAGLLGGGIGLEREWSGKPAGFRTNLLICVGATLLTELSLAVAVGAGEGLLADPGRIAAQIVSGIGFLGAGTIIQSRVGVTGLTTAATMWVVAAIGMAVGARAYAEAVGTAVVVMAALLLLSRVEGRVPQQFEGRLRVSLAPDEALVEEVEALVGSRVERSLLEMERTGDEIVLTYMVAGHRRRWTDLLRELIRLEGVSGVKGS